VFGISFSELLLIAVVALLVLGPDKLPAALKTVGKVMREFRRATRELRDQLDVEGTLREAMGEPPLRPPPAPRITAPSRIYPPEGVDCEDVLEEPSEYPPNTPYAAREETGEDEDAAPAAPPVPVPSPAPSTASASPPPAAAAAPVIAALVRDLAPAPASPAPGPGPASFGSALTDDLDAGWGGEGLELALAPQLRPSTPPSAPTAPPEPPPAPRKSESHRERRARKRQKAVAQVDERPESAATATPAETPRTRSVPARGRRRRSPK
jgi:sec-independent protein translocase protein TatB